MNTIFRYLFAFLLLGVSCTQEEPQEDDVIETVPECSILYEGEERDNLSVRYESCILTLTVRSNVAWSVRAEDSSWISFSVTHGRASEEGMEIVMTVSENNTSEPRQTDVVLKAGEAEKRLTLTQNCNMAGKLEWETSYEFIQSMGVGWNLGNTLDADNGTDHDGSDWRYWETCWGQPETTQELMNMMKRAGFGAIRVPVTWRPHISPDGTVSDAWMNRVKEIVDHVLNAGMYCIINVHHDTGADDDAWLVADPDTYKAQKARYEHLWRQIAEKFRDYDHRLLFESYNEMLDSRRSWCFASFNGGYDAVLAEGAYDAINSYAQSFIDVVRSTDGNNSVRNLIVNTYGACNGDGDWNPHLQDPLIYMDLPEDSAEDHLLFEVHAYPTIDDMNAMPSATEKMFARLDELLASKGAPVIMGEWGTFSENPPMEDMLEFADCFVKTAKKYGIGTFYWMGLSDALDRMLPAFTLPELAKAIVNAYHGDASAYSYPVSSDFYKEYLVTYDNQWAELNLVGETISMDDYSGVSFELEDVPANGELSVKVYGESDGMEQYSGVSEAAPVITFDRAAVGSKARRITLQFMKSGSYTTHIRNVELVRHDGTREPVENVSVFWGCSVELISSPK